MVSVDSLWEHNILGSYFESSGIDEKKKGASPENSKNRKTPRGQRADRISH